MKSISIEIEETPNGTFALDIFMDRELWMCERTSRNYASESDAITSARHAVNEFRKAKDAAPEHK